MTGFCWHLTCNPFFVILTSTISNISSIFSLNSEAFASELRENLEDLFPRFYMKSDIFRMFKSSATHKVVYVMEKIILKFKVVSLWILANPDFEHTGVTLVWHVSVISWCSVMSRLHAHFVMKQQAVRHKRVVQSRRTSELMWYIGNTSR